MPEARNPLLGIFHVKKIYKAQGCQVKVFEDLNLVAYPGEFIAITGPTGCGKTTLVNLITGLDKPTAGVIHVNGISTTELSEGQLSSFRTQKLGIVFQTPHLLPYLSVRENVELPLIIKGVDGKQRAQRVEETLRATGLTSLAQRRIRSLSSGEMQMVEIARAIALDPEILVMDEPTEYLDLTTTDSILMLLKSLSLVREKLVLVTTHSKRVAQSAQRVIPLKKRLKT